MNVATIQRQLDAARKREAALREERRALKAKLADAWKHTAEGRTAHVQGYTHRRAIEGAARKYGHAFGDASAGFRAMLAARLVEVDAADGVLDAGCAQSKVETWAREGKRETVGDHCNARGA